MISRLKPKLFAIRLEGNVSTALLYSVVAAIEKRYVKQPVCFQYRLVLPAIAKNSDWLSDPDMLPPGFLIPVMRK